MEIQNLKDLKDVLAKIPNEVLENFVVGLTGRGVTLATTEGENEGDMGINYERDLSEHPNLDTIRSYIENIVKASEKDDPEPITS